MAYENVLTALADPTRRRILEALRVRPRTVSGLADEQPVSRPAVSQHLRVLEGAGLVEAEKRGTTRVYRVRPDGLATLRAYLDRMWGEALTAYAETLNQESDPAMPTQGAQPVVKTLDIAVGPERAFEVFVHRINSWWPLDKHSVAAMSGGVARSVALEPRVGGRIVETGPDGESVLWGTVAAYEPGRRLTLNWHINCPVEEATIVDVRFEARDGGARVVLTHDGWEAMGERGPRMREGYNMGWVGVFETAFAAACAGITEDA